MSAEASPQITIHIPTPLRAYADDQAEVTVKGQTVSDALRDLTEQHPDLHNHLYKEDGQLRSFVNIYREDEDIRYLDDENTELSDGATLSIVPSIAGGLGHPATY